MTKNSVTQPPSEHAQAFGHAVGEIWKSMQGLSLPIPALSALQAEYMQQATEMWNGAVERVGPGHRRVSPSATAALPPTTGPAIRPRQ